MKSGARRFSAVNSEGKLDVTGTWFLRFGQLHAILILAGVLRSAGLAQSQTSPHGTLSIACEDCHTANSWTVIASPMKFDHGRTKFPLKGQHDLVQCKECHTSLVFSEVQQQCADCHMDVHNSELGGACQRCHTSDSWLVPDIRQRHAQTRFALVGAHETVACQACHINEQKHEYAGTATDCFGCHQSDFESTAAPAHRAAGIGTNCETCHSVSAVTWGGNFDHSTTSFPLTGAHATVPCMQCHTGNRFKGTPTQCVNCHQQDFNSASNPNHTQAGFNTQCAGCHTTASWANATFNHDQFFPLTGAHTAVTCAQCHANNQFTNAATQCVGCHLNNWTTATAPVQHSPGMSQTCENCHTTTAWQPSTFNHNTTAYPLTGGHLTLATCAQCHANGTYAGTTTQCVGCHQQDFNGTTSPNHPAAGIGTDCQSCHTPATWGTGVFDHNRQTTFALTGAHPAVPCIQCHANNQFQGLPTQCVGCHMTQFNATVNPVHAPGISTTCQTCHSTAAWQPSTFNHSATGFRLAGAHAAIACASCHKNGAFANTPTQCVHCHQQDFNTTTNPNHAQAGFNTQCANCHTPTSWGNAAFNHTQFFPLTGAHAAVACTQCHANNNFSSAPTQCVGCHLTNWTNATAPVQHSPGISQTCETCHTTTAWQPSTFNHNTTGYPLVGGHLTLATCAQCHANGIYAGTTTQCVGCHQQDFNATTSPNHAAAGIGTDCQSCHTPATWGTGVFDHNTQTTFALTGAHPAVPCVQCHANNQFQGLPTQCVGCHMTQYTGTLNPQHSPGMPTTCQTCHSTAAWQPGVFNHSATGFRLSGAHLALACASCHKNGAFANTPAQCVNCHQQDFNNTSNPNHATSGFGTDCQSCHTPASWGNAAFDHNKFFPLTGAHAAVPCNQCHVNNVFAGTPTTCVGCHLTTWTNATAPVQHSPGMAQTCQNCHTTTAWQPSTFNHSTYYTLTGGHLTIATCAQCHVNASYAGTATACYTCHQSTFIAATTPVPHTGFPTDCSTCHTTNPGWSPSTYSHANTTPRFPQDHDHTPAITNNQCFKCHQNAANYTQYCCQYSGCHNTCAGGD